MAYYPLEKLINLDEGYRRQFRVGAHDILLLVDQGQYFICEALCPHLASPLIRSALVAGKIQCAKHGFEFDLASGTHSQARQTGCRALQVYPPAFDGDTLGVEL